MPDQDDEQESPPKGASSISRSKIWEWAKDALALAVIPLVGWIINLSVQNALRDEHISQLQAEVVALHDQQKEIDEVKDDVGKANLQMVRLEGKIDLANGRLDEIKSLLR